MLDVGAVAAKPGRRCRRRTRRRRWSRRRGAGGGAGVPVSADTFSAEVARRGARRRRGADQRHLRRLGGDVRAGRRERLRLRPDAHRGAAAGRPRAPRLRRRRRPPQGLVRGASRAGTSPWASPRSRSRSTPASTSTSAPSRTSRSCAGSASCAGSGCRSTSRSRARTSSAPCSPAPGSSAAGRASASGGRSPPSPWRSAAGAEVLRVHDRSSLQAMQGRGRDRGQRRDARSKSPARDSLGDRDRPGPPRRPHRRRELRGGARRTARARCRASLDPAFAEALARAGVERLYSHQREALERRGVIEPGRSPAAPPRARASPSTCRSSTASPATRSGAPSTSTRPRRSPRTRRASSRELRPPGLREAIYDGDTPREERPAIRRRSNLVLTNPDMLHVGLLPNHKAWGDFLANLGWVVVDEAHTYRGVFGSHVANVLRRLRRVARAYGAEPRFLLASATIANPVELAERLVGEPLRADRRRRRPARRARDRDVEPAADRRGDRDAALGRSPRRPSCSPSSSPRACGRSASSRAGAGSS